MTGTAFRRLTRMRPTELRFRLACELRKTAGRARTALSTPGWDRGGLAQVLSASPQSASWHTAVATLRQGDYRAAHAALADHFATRTSAFPLNARHLPAVAQAIRSACPDAAADAARRAGRLLAGRYDLLGYTGLALGPIPDWHRDVVHERQSPRLYWAAVPFLDPAAGDHKVIWELNRHQHWLALGRAHALADDRRCYDAFTTQLASWLDANPPLLGTNWASMLEVAFRSLSWLWALELFTGAAAAADGAPWLVDLLLALDRQLTHVEHNLSHYFSPNTHLTGEALALYVAGLALPELRASARRTAIGRDVLLAEIDRQLGADGGHAELSGHYHRYSTDFYLLAANVARRAGDPAAPAFADAARRQARFLRTISDDRGRRPAFGDDDGGQLFPMCGRPPDDCRDTLAIAASLLGEPGLRIGSVPEEAYWMCGGDAAGDPAAAEPAAWPSAALRSSGYFVSRSPRGDHLIFDAGRHGYLNGGHAHADALSLTLQVAGLPLLIDPGTATYTMDPALRDRFRSSAMHNTVALDGRPQSEPRGAFHWRTRAHAQAPIWQSSDGWDYVEGTHDGYAPHRHTRGILAIHGVGWWIVDHVLGTGAAGIAPYWHIHPSWGCSLAADGRVCRLEGPAAVLALASSAPLELLAPGSHPLAFHSPAYGMVEPAPVARGLITAPLPATVAAFVPASPDMTPGLAIEQLPVEEAPGPAWHAAAFAVRWTDGVVTLIAAVERSGIAGGSASAPGGRWGAAGLRTDRRLAARIERTDGSSRCVVV